MDLDARLKTFLGQKSTINPSAYVAKSAELFGDVRLGPNSSVWPQCVLRADINFIDIGEGSNVQDGTIIHLADDYPVQVGAYVTIGHRAIIHACTIGHECLIGMGAIVMDGAVVGPRSIIAAGALVPKGMQVPDGSLVMGVPGKIIRTLNEEEQSKNRYWAQKYIKMAAAHRRS